MGPTGTNALHAIEVFAVILLRIAASFARLARGLFRRRRVGFGRRRFGFSSRRCGYSSYRSEWVKRLRWKVDRAERRLRQYVPAHTGRLRRSLNIVIGSSGNPSYYVAVPYDYVEFGPPFSRRHRVRSRRAKSRGTARTTREAIHQYDRSGHYSGLVREAQRQAAFRCDEKEAARRRRRRRRRISWS